MLSKASPKILVAVLLVLGAATSEWSSPSDAEVPKLDDTGAYGYFASVGLFGGPPNNSGPAPTVTLPAQQGTNAPVTAVIPSARAQFGPAVIFQSGEVKVSTQRAPGPTGSVTSSATVTGVGDAPLPLLYENVTSTCTARGSELSGSTTLSGQLATSTYTAPDPREGDPRDLEPLPPNPPPNTERTGELSNVGDRFRVVFNEQIREGDILTVNAVHMYLLGPIAIGDLVIAQSRCGAEAAAPPGGPNPAPTSPTTGPTGEGGSATSTSEVAAGDNEAPSTAVLPLALGALVLVAGAVALLLLRRRKAAPADRRGDGGG